MGIFIPSETLVNDAALYAKLNDMNEEQRYEETSAHILFLNLDS